MRIILILVLLSLLAAAGCTSDSNPEQSPTTNPDAVFAVGDSVMQAASDKYCGTLSALIPRLELADVDGMSGRQFAAAEGFVSDWVASGGTADVLLIALGTNGPVSTDAFDDLMVVAESFPKVVFVTLKAPRDHIAASNDVIREGAERYDNVSIIDWEAASSDHPEYFSNSELFHLNCDPGARAYAELVAGEL